MIKRVMNKYLLKTNDRYCLRQGQKYYKWNSETDSIRSERLVKYQAGYCWGNFYIWHKRHAKHLYKYKENCVPKALRELRRLKRYYKTNITETQTALQDIEKKIQRLKNSTKN